MRFETFNQRLGRFEKLESRWLLASDTICEVPVDGTGETNIEIVAQLLDPENADDGTDRSDVSLSKSIRAELSDCDDQSRVNDGRLSLGGEGESSSFDEGQSASTSATARAAEILGQMLDFVNHQQQADQTPPVESDSSTTAQRAGIIPADFQRLNASTIRQSNINYYTVPANVSLNIDDNESPRPTASSANERTPHADDETQPDEVASNSDQAEFNDTTGRANAQTEFSNAATIDFDGSPAVSSRRVEQPVESEFALEDQLDLSWISNGSNNEARSDGSTNRIKSDDALMSYLRTIQWPLVPLVAGLAYALSRSIDQQNETPEPQAVRVNRKQFQRLRTYDW
jgi:hypothetical protein